jgi:MazG family protein
MPKLDELLGIMAKLRDPEGGCPWDLAQDFASISPHTIEEAYEVDEAIASGDLEALRDELGDLLFQVVFQARIAEEKGAFDFGGVVEAILDKLIRRHPHIFADAETPESVAGQRLHWEEIKAAERAAAGRLEPGPTDPFVGIPRSLPALARSAKVAGRLERLGSGARPSTEDAVSASLDEIVGQAEALRRRFGKRSSPPPPDGADGQKDSADEARRWIGQGLQAWVRLARALDLDPEQALRAADDEAIERARAGRESG